MSSLTSASHTVGTSAVLIHQADGDGNSVAVYNESDTTIYLGGSGVLTTTGFPVEAGAVLSLNMAPADSMYAITTLASKVVRALVSDR